FFSGEGVPGALATTLPDGTIEVTVPGVGVAPAIAGKTFRGTAGTTTALSAVVEPGANGDARVRIDAGAGRRVRAYSAGSPPRLVIDLTRTTVASAKPSGGANATAVAPKGAAQAPVPAPSRSPQAKAPVRSPVPGDAAKQTEDTRSEPKREGRTPDKAPGKNESTETSAIAAQRPSTSAAASSAPDAAKKAGAPAPAASASPEDASRPAATVQSASADHDSPSAAS